MTMAQGTICKPEYEDLPKILELQYRYKKESRGQTYETRKII